MTEKHTPDQPIVKGADVIYRPAGEAGEYAPLATNPWRGCGHGCKYCYVPLATHQKRDEFNKAAILREGYLERLERDVARHRAAGICAGHPADQVFVTFSSDPFHLGDLGPTRQVMKILQQGRMSFCTLSKGGSRALDFIDLYRPARDAYACTLTSLNPEFSTMWEPLAALPHDRIVTLQAFHDRGIFTWVSLEPTLDVEASLELVWTTHQWVDLYKVGRANYLKEITRTTDWRDYTVRMIALLQRLGKRHYIKRDLQAFLPPGYDNPLRIAQHR